MRRADLPWLERSLQVLDLRRKDRLLLVLPGDAELTRFLGGLVGVQGAVTVVEPRRQQAESIAEALPGAEVLALEPRGGERFGAFDAVLGIPFATTLPVEVWAELVAVNLRPGGRFALDLPAPDPIPDVREAALEAQLACAPRYDALGGPEEGPLVEALLRRGMRQVDRLLGTHLMQLQSPFDLADLVAPGMELDVDERLQLGEALARRLKSTDAVETLVNRTSVAGMH